MMNRNKGFTFIIILLMLYETNSARILAIYPTPSISHQMVFRTLTLELLKRGHEMHVITTDPMYSKAKAPSNLIEIDIHDISYEQYADIILRHRGQKSDQINLIRAVIERIGIMFDLQFHTPAVQEVLKKDQDYFDLIILEAYATILLGIQYLFNAPIIQISSFGAILGQYCEYGAPDHSFLYPLPGAHKQYNLTVIDKVTEIIKYVYINIIVDSYKMYNHQVMNKIFKKEIPINDNLFKKVAILFLNEYPIWANNHPVPPNIIYIGGIHQTATKDLPKDIQAYLDSTKNGIIYVSFGTSIHTSHLPKDKIQVMMKVFSELNYDILMKWDTDDLPGRPNNVRIYKWLPQIDILRHSNIKLFITQGGLQSTDETIDAGVPVLGIPTHGDQWYNTEKYVHYEIGLQLDMETFTEKELKDAIENIIENKSFKDNIIKLGTLRREQPTKPLDLAVWWVEHVIKFGGDHLKPPSAHISLAQYFELELVICALCLLILFMCLICNIKMVFKLLRVSVARLKKD